VNVLGLINAEVMQVDILVFAIVIAVVMIIAIANVFLAHARRQEEYIVKEEHHARITWVICSLVLMYLVIFP
jgi:hypothetical protein